MKQIIVDIPDDMESKITGAVVCGLAESEEDAVIKALRFYFGERRS